MRNTSTPLRQVCLQNRLNSNGRRSMNSSRTVKQLNQQQTPVLLENTDDELERAERRRSVALRKSITNLPSSSLNDSFQQFSEDDMKYQIQFCTKLYNENRINPKNVWGLQIIDALKHMVKIDVQTDLLRVVGSSLEVAGKVYAVRVDSLYEQGMRMASNLARQFKQNTEDATNDVSTGEGGEGEVLDHVRKKRAKPKFFLNGKKKVTVNSENWQDSLLKLESCVFSARTDPNLSAIDNLFTNTLKMDSSCLKFMPLSTDKSWITNGDCLITKQKKYSFKAPKLDNFRLCIPFKDFTLDEWNVDDKKELSDVAMDSADQLIFDDNGIPIHQMDGSLHHVFEEPGVGDDDDDDLHNVEEVNAVPNFREDVEYIVDLRPTNQYSSSIERSECPMNSLVQTMFGRMEDIWAGPSHWKLKFIKSSTSMYTGRVEHQAPIERKKRKKQDWQPHDLEQFINAPAYDTSQKAVQRNVKLVDRSKLCVPLPDPTAYPRFKQNLDYLMTNTIRKIKLSQKSSESELVDCDVSAYKYDNPTDVNYLPQHDDDLDGINNDHGYEELFTTPEAAPVGLFGDNLVDVPEMVNPLYVPYAQKAKKMDMKKLKVAIWKVLTKGKTDEISVEQKIIPMQFSDLYKQLQNTLPEKMLSELSCHLAFVSILDLSNQLFLKLNQSDITDFEICKA